MDKKIYEIERLFTDPEMGYSGVDLTPFIPLSLKGEGELILKEGLTALLDTPTLISPE